MVVKPIFRGELHALVFVVQDEVDDTAHRVGAVGRRGAAGENLHALDQFCRDEVQVDGRRSARGAARLHAPPVDQHDRALRTESAQVDRRNAVRAIGDLGPLGGEDLRHGVEDVLHARLAGLLDVGAGDRRHRAYALQVGYHDARTGDDDFLHRLLWSSRRRGCLTVSQRDCPSRRARRESDANRRPHIATRVHSVNSPQVDVNARAVGARASAEILHGTTSPAKCNSRLHKIL